MLEGERTEGLSILGIGGELSRHVAEHDWSATPLGSAKHWPSLLRTTLATVLASPFSMMLAWGPELITFYNDAYRPILGGRSDALGRPFLDVWPEARDILAPLLARALAGEPCRFSDAPFTLLRNGGPEETFFDFAFSPVRDERGAIVAVINIAVETTARVMAERARMESERRLSEGVAASGLSADFRALFEASPTPFIVIAPPDWTIVAANDARLRITGTTREEQIGRRLFDLFPDDPDDPTADGVRNLTASLDRVLATKSTDTMAVQRYAVREPDGRFVERWWTPVNTPVLGNDGEVALIIHRVEEVTELMRLRGDAAAMDELARHQQAVMERLRESEARLRLATEHAEIGFWDVDEINQALHWPELVKRLFGISPDVPVTMQDFYDGLHPDDRERVGAAYTAAADPDRRALYDVEYRTIGKEDGVLRWIAAKGRGVFDERGRCIRVVGTAMDISARKAAETALAEREHQLQQLNDTLERRVAKRTRERDQAWRNSRDLQIVLDKLGVFSAANDAWATILGYSPEEITGRHFLDFIHPDDAASSNGALVTASSGPLPVFENRYRHADGSWRWVSWVAAPEGELIYASGRDVTAEKERQAALEATQEQLRQAQKMEAVGQLTGGIAHDFNNLLQGVAGSLDLIRRKPTDRERVQRWAEAGLKAAERGAKLTGQLLAFSRTQKLELKPVLLSDLVAGFRDMLDRTIGTHIQVTLELTTDNIRVLGDEVQIEMAVLNLALNARDAMPGGGELTISTRPITLRDDSELADGDYVELAVRDTGGGIPPEVITRVFDPFFTTKGVGKGTGLGLSQVYGAMRQTGGGVRIESRVGEGTTVRLLLRRTDDLEALQGADVAQEQKPAFSARILIIDDDADVRHFLVESLDALGFTVIQAEDGYAGLAAVERANPDLIILDFAMPGLNGAEVAERVKAQRPNLPIVFATGFAESAAIEVTAGPGASVLRKPFGIDELQRVLTAALTKGVIYDGFIA